MRDISDFKKAFCKVYAEKCDQVETDDISLCSLKDYCTCRLAAEVQAYLFKILPRGYQKFTIFSFDGRKGDKWLLDSSKVLTIKNQISKYCWNMEYPALNDIHVKNPLEVDKYSVLDRRRRDGDCIVIHGDAAKQSGRTLIASVILREVIRRRFTSNMNALQSYDWIEFSNLDRDIKSDRFSNYQYADWLVVDNFRQLDVDSPRFIQNYIVSVLDPFFVTRIEENLPSILVFRFDLNTTPVKQIFGIGIDKIIHNENTIIITL